ncbi:MAG: flagellar basal body L-ring protein FlgH [Rickettsiales bacterium]|nr:flagellar basal body L-ring protein FlgH [Rickettsiales bacterium]
MKLIDTATLFLLTMLAALALSACTNTMDRLEQIGKQPEFKEMENPQARPRYRPMTWPLPNPEVETSANPNSLWQPGARAFFRDQRAARVGDILRVKVEINDKAELDNETIRERDASDTMAAASLFGNLRGRLLPGAAADNLLDITGSAENEGIGEIQREEKITTQVAAVVTQLLPNGNMVIEGSQEIRVNYEIRELSVRGVVRPEDIGSDNTIDSSMIAEARINYGGRGQLTDVQQPRWGYQVIDVISPF